MAIWGKIVTFSIEKSMILVFCLQVLLLAFNSQMKEVPIQLWKEKMYSRINFTLTPSKACTDLFHLRMIKALSWKMNALTQTTLSWSEGIVIATNTKYILQNPKGSM